MKRVPPEHIHTVPLVLYGLAGDLPICQSEQKLSRGAPSPSPSMSRGGHGDIDDRGHLYQEVRCGIVFVYRGYKLGNISWGCNRHL